LHRKTNNNKKLKNMNAVLKYGLNLAVAIIFVCFAIFDCAKDSYGEMVMDLSIVFLNCFALLFLQNAERNDTLKEIEKKLKGE